MPYRFPDEGLNMGLETVFSGNPLDRADRLRGDENLFRSHMDNPETRIMLWGEDKLLSHATGNPAWRHPADVSMPDPERAVFLGLDDGAVPHWALDAGELAAYITESATPRDLRGAAMKPDARPAELAIAAQAKAMLGWHARHRFCSNCGAPTLMTRAGYERRCPACHTPHYPRTDPVVIMLATHKEKALVGRGPQLPPGIMTALAGFMEPGEKIEESVARELEEEAGLKTTGVRYVGSQPWPWPSTLMIGCIAAVADTVITLDTTEVEEAQWINRAEARQALAGAHPSFALPPPLAIARQLVEVWANED